MSVCRLLAPFAPFVSDWMHRELTGESVHLAPFVAPARSGGRRRSTRPMAAIRTLARLGRAAREEVGIKVRQPLGADGLRRARACRNRRLSRSLPLLAAELNVKRGRVRDAPATRSSRCEAKPNFRSLGKKFGKKTPLAAQARCGVRPASSSAPSSTASRWSLALRGESHELDAGRSDDHSAGVGRVSWFRRTPGSSRRSIRR